MCTWRGELYPGSMRSVGFVARIGLVALPLLAGLAACSLSPHTKREQRIYDARERANRTFSPSDAIDLAMAIHHAYEQGDYASNYAQLSSDALSAHYALQRVAVDGSPETPLVLAWRGVMYEDTGRVTEAREEYRKSLELQPSFLVAAKLVPIYGTFHDAESVIHTCKLAYPVLNKVDKQIGLIEVCEKELSRLVPKDQTLAWLDPQAAAWYQREVARREKAALAEQELRRQRKERAEKVATYVQRCATACHGKGVACQDACTPGDPACNARCETSYNACVDRCEAAAQKALTPAPVKSMEEERRTDPSARAASKA